MGMSSAMTLCLGFLLPLAGWGKDPNWVEEIPRTLMPPGAPKEGQMN